MRFGVAHVALTRRVAQCMVSRYKPPTATFSSSHGATGATVTSAAMTFTATFTSAVTGVVASDFGLSSSVGTVTTSASASTTDNIKWVLSVTVTGNYAATQLSVTMPDDSGSITPKNGAASNNGFLLQYSPPKPTLSSSSGPTTTSDTTILVTATFDTAVTGVAVADFNGGSAFPSVPGITYSVAAGTGGAWVLTIALAHSPRNSRSWTFNFVAGSGSISQPNAAAVASLPLT